MEIDHTCANPSCDCRVKNTGDFCSENCEQHADDKELTPCACGHADCGTSTPETPGVPDQDDASKSSRMT